jgi:hypothetical protein
MLVIRGAIASMSVEKQTKVKAAYSRLKDLEMEFGQEEALLAVALRGAEVAAEEE